jgi:hypothetical protein
MNAPIRAARVEQLFIGARFTGVTVECDAIWPGMWRVRQGAELSDIINISRAKDAAIAWARPRGLGGGEVVHWHRRQCVRRGPPVRPNGRGRV